MERVCVHCGVSGLTAGAWRLQAEVGGAQRKAESGERRVEEMSLIREVGPGSVGT